MKHCFIVNRASGNGKGIDALVDRIKALCVEKGLDYSVDFTEYPCHAQEIVKAVAEKSDVPVRFYACGGDGTINEVVNGIIQNGKGELAVIPIGTGNDFVRSFCDACDFLCLENLVFGKSIKVDTVSMGNGVFANMLNVGFDSSVVQTIANSRDKSPLMRGKLAYIIGVCINFIKMPKTRLSCTFDDGEKVEGEFLLSAFSNGKYYGGGFKAASRAEVDDGILDVLFVRPCPRLVFLTLISKYKKGTLLDDERSGKYIIFKKCRNLSVSFSSESPVCVDGELVEEKDFEIKVLPSSLDFVVPCKVSVKPAEVLK